MTAGPARVTSPASVICAVVIALLTLALACGQDAPAQDSSRCGNGPLDLGNAIEGAETKVNFEVMTPSYLPATTSSVLEVTVHTPDEVSLLFPPCPEITPAVLGPRVVIIEE